MNKIKIKLLVGIIIIVALAIVIVYNPNIFNINSTLSPENTIEPTISSLELKVTGVEFTPNVYLDNNKIVGIDTEIASKALENAGIKFEISLTDPSAQDYNKNVTGQNRAFLTTGYSVERKDSYKWAGPTSQGMYGIFSKGESSPAYPLSIEDSMKLEPIAVVKNWLETTTLEDLGFKNLVYFDTYGDALSAFMNDKVKYIASDFFHLTKSLPEGYYMQNVYAVTRYRTVFYYLAFSNDVSDEVVSKVQKEIDKMIEDKTVETVMQRYFKILLPEFIPGTLQLFAEVAPPYNFQTGLDISRQATGSTVEMINEIQKRNGYANRINISTWIDAYSLPQYLPNSAVFTIARTPERENMFQWVGPVSTNKTYFYTLASSSIDINTLEQAKNLKSIATPREWYTHVFLRNNDFKNIVATALTSAEAFQQLVSGEVEALFLTDVDVKWLAKEKGISENILKQNLMAIDYDGYIAFSLNTPVTTVNNWQAILDEMKSDGTFDAIWKKWFDGIEKPTPPNKIQ